MAKNKYYTHVQPRLTEIAELSRKGATQAEIAERLGVSRVTLGAYAQKYGEMGDALAGEMLYHDEEVKRAMYTMALEGNTTAQMNWFKIRQMEREREQDDSGDDELVIRIAAPDDLTDTRP